MIGGINSGSNYAYQTGNNSLARERSDTARLPASSPEKSAESARRELSDGKSLVAIERGPDTNLERRIEARRAAEDARLERFRADDLPLPTARALSTFATIAAAGQESGGDASLAGIDILV
ncbi:UDP pyrophosphate phosphatase [Marinobacter arenosus]|uniref:UDP pyrophosphate phosphatase n=1 Tax=Marinobacter arenosus TaxID=2856822 RepID=UPI001C4C4184|nr:UDP pyrophosphate phosphatase [Marinobacter arenosus]MBW0148901.1 UDP pyrophosphate phosphatase [Marinobacter arenosus]